jgi:hypothetical protein
MPKVFKEDNFFFNFYHGEGASDLPPPEAPAQNTKGTRIDDL